jgi:DNA invertase Pin-like site-specific DNA recombinase
MRHGAWWRGCEGGRWRSERPGTRGRYSIARAREDKGRGMRSKPSRVLGYVRVSGREQGASGTSLDFQREEIERHCKLNGYPAPQIRIEVESAGAEKIDKRVVLRELMADVRPGDLVIVAKQDRWSRHTLFFLSSTQEIVDKGASFFSIAERFDPQTHEGKFAATIMAAVAEQERARIYDRTVGTRKLLRDQGMYVEGLPPFGYRRAPKPQRILLVNEPNASFVRALYERCAEGQALRELTEWAQVERPDRKWSRSSVRDILRTRTYLGEVKTSTGAWVKSHEPIVSRATWQSAQDQLTARRLRPPGRYGSWEAKTVTWLARGLATCAECGSRMGPAYGKKSSDVSYYACAMRLRGDPCHARYVRVPDADAELAEMVLTRLRQLREALAKEPDGRVARKARPTRDFAGERLRIARSRERAIEFATDGAINREELRARLTKLDAELGRLEVEAAKAAREIDMQAPAARRAMLASVDVLDAVWSKATPQERREVLRSLTREIVLEAGKSPRVTWKSLGELGRGEAQVIRTG